ncbi:hypothetical protein VaNZ11_000652 [Volvox africanus]|uniref:Centrosomal protein of 19 kDa n=1 Tax=Volvox africanus TaxID=51714 RepID=A0ABQ5RNK2_9CHLO|nr:hypothetical protein VaNZ11_000652 [Volvox africanus]
MPNTASSQTLNPAVENGGSRKETTAESEGSYKAKRYAVKFQPPCIFLEYEDTTRRRRVRAVKLNGVQPNVDVDRLTKKVIRSFPRRLDPTSVKYDQVRRLVVSLVDFLSAGTHGANGVVAGAGAAANGSATMRNGTSSHVPSRLGPGGGTKVQGRLSDFNDHANPANGGASVASPLPSLSPRGVDPRIGPAARMAMAGISSNYRGSVESTMSRFSTSTASPSDSGGSTSEEETDEGKRRNGGGLASALDDLDKEMAGLGGSTSELSTRATAGGPGGVSSKLEGDFCSSPSSTRDRPLPPLGTSISPAPSRMGSMDAQAGAAMVADSCAKTRFAAEAEKLVIGLEVTNDLDLNKVTEVELKLAKQAMEEDFKKNQLRPGDPGYVYDKQEEFGPPTEVNDWDETDDDDGLSEEPEVDWADIHASVSKPKGTFTSVQVNAGLSSEEESAGRNGQSPYNSNDWP